MTIIQLMKSRLKMRQMIVINVYNNVEETCLAAYEHICPLFASVNLLICPYPYKQIRQSYEGLVKRFGKYNRTLKVIYFSANLIYTLKAGFHYINPCTEQLEIVDIKIRVTDLEKQSVITRDNISIQVDASVYWKITNPRKARYKVDNVGESISQLTFQTVRNICGQHTLQELLENRDQITKAIQQHVEEHVFGIQSLNQQNIKQFKEWGTRIDQIFIKDILLAYDVQQSLAAAASGKQYNIFLIQLLKIEKRLAEAKIISAKADVEASKLMKQAAGALDIAPAMQIRYFETIQRICSSKQNRKIIFLPLDKRQKIQK